MSFARARIVRAAEGARAAPRVAAAAEIGPSAERRRRIAREELEARAAAAQIVEAAERSAQERLARARAEATAVAEQAAREAAERAEAEVAARWLRLRRDDDARLAQEAHTVVAAGVALAERLLGAALELEPSRIAAMAQTALAEARGARRVRIDACPADVPALERHLRAAALGPHVADVRADETLARGELRLQTDVGTIDAKLSPRLERLAAALRDALV